MRRTRRTDRFERHFNEEAHLLDDKLLAKVLPLLQELKTKQKKAGQAAACTDIHCPPPKCRQVPLHAIGAYSLRLIYCERLQTSG